MLHEGGVDEDDLEHHDEDGDSNNEGDGQPNAKVVQKDLENTNKQCFLNLADIPTLASITITCAHTV